MKPISNFLINLSALCVLSSASLGLACEKPQALKPQTIMGVATTTTAATSSLVATEAYARAVPPGQTNSAVFMQLQNTDRQAHALVKAASPVAKVVELHNHLNENGVMKMRQVEQIELPAGKTVALKPGSFHIMLIGLNKPLKVGEIVELSLSFEDGTSLQLSAPVQEVAAPMH